MHYITYIKFVSSKLQLASFCNYSILFILVLNIGETTALFFFEFPDGMFDIFKKLYMIKFEEINCSAYRSNEIVSFLATYWNNGKQWQINHPEKLPQHHKKRNSISQHGHNKLKASPFRFWFGYNELMEENKIINQFPLSIH